MQNEKFLTSYVVLAVLMCLSPRAVWAGEILMGYGGHFSAPYTHYSADKLTGGWIYETSQALSQILNQNVEPVSIPRKRYEAMLKNGEIDLYCFTNPAWAENHAGIMWSAKLFTVQNLVLTREELASELRRTRDMKGLYVGTILGYSYARLTAMFAHGQATRIDNTSFKQNYEMLQAGRLDAVIVPDTIGSTLLDELDMSDRFKFAPYVVSQRALHCAISSHADRDADRIRQALDALLNQGHFDWGKDGQARVY
ncbi:MAG: ABC transporter substrate-binding protein [Magnetovibrio sp.]|nr:ABC transporter substrate-binding protein [Magnetovibrio sp.]